ncbi:MAG: aldo/keto reductase [Planctomycetota bacterium]|nr:aldo/keto reductase [Planctomycetota bacterium]
MRYRRFGRLDYQASVLGFGTMRLPVIGGDASKVDEEPALALIRYAIDHGINYVDSAHGYHGGNSEVVTGKALAGGYRSRVKIATKMPCWSVESAGDFDRLLDEQLGRLQTDTIDFYLLHCLNNKFWDKLRGLGVLPWAEKMIAKGRIGGLGFSCHEEFADFRRYLDEYGGWTMCQIQYNYLDQNNQAGTRGLEYAASKGLPVTVMEPLRGGRLAAEPPPSVRAVWDSAPVRRTPADWALQWVWNHPQVTVALSGMNTMQQLQENLASADRAAAESLSPAELALYDRVVAAYREASPVPCTACGYCVPCPNGVNIPRVFEIYNESAFYADMGVPRYTYARLAEAERANKCAKCGTCEERCPQKIHTMDALAQAHEKLKG